MNKMQRIKEFWKDVVSQDAASLKTFFTEDAIIRWHCTNEQFNAEEYIIANCEYPGTWRGEIERISDSANLVITATRVWSEEENVSFHVVSFFRMYNEKIIELDEYWGDDGEMPQWRREKRIGKPIHEKGRTE